MGIRNTQGTVVTTLYPNSTASRLGIQLEDRLISIGSLEISNYADLVAAMGAMRVGQEISVVIERDGSRQTLGPANLSGKAVVAAD